MQKVTRLGVGTLAGNQGRLMVSGKHLPAQMRANSGPVELLQQLRSYECSVCAMADLRGSKVFKALNLGESG